MKEKKEKEEKEKVILEICVCLFFYISSGLSDVTVLETEYSLINDFKLMNFKTNS